MSSSATPLDPKDLSDADLLREYQKTDGEPGDPVTDALLAATARRELDI